MKKTYYIYCIMIGLVFAFSCDKEDPQLQQSQDAEGYAASTCTRTLRSFGAKAKAGVDDTEAIKRAFQSNCILNGEGLKYEVRGSIRMERAVQLRRATFVDNGKANNPMSIEVIGRNDMRIENVTFDRGRNPAVGSIGASRTLNIIRCNNLRLRQLTFFGHGRGTALSLIDVDRGWIDDVTIRDMGWRNANVQSEQLIGLWAQRTKNLKIQRANIRNLYEIRADGSRFTRETDGITFGGSSSFDIWNCFIKNVGEGIDVTGSDGNTSFEVRDCRVEDAYAFGIKFANSAYNGKVYDCKVYRAGYAGFVFGGPSEPNLPFKTRDIQLYGCEAFDTGSNGYWSPFNVAGFLILEGRYDKNYPQDIRIFNAKSEDRQGRKTMKFGFFNQIRNAGNRLQNTDSFGHLIEGSRGFD